MVLDSSSGRESASAAGSGSLTKAFFGYDSSSPRAFICDDGKMVVRVILGEKGYAEIARCIDIASGAVSDLDLRNTILNQVEILDCERHGGRLEFLCEIDDELELGRGGPNLLIDMSGGITARLGGLERISGHPFAWNPSLACIVSVRTINSDRESQLTAELLTYDYKSEVSSSVVVTIPVAPER